MFYVDCTGFYGSGSHEKPEFPELSDLLKEMDRLGIWASVVSNAQARDGNANYGNHRLMEDIEKTPGAGDRIIPAFVVSPKCICESGTMEYTKEMLASGRVGALSVYPVTGRFELGHLERVFDELCEYSPVVMVDCLEVGGATGYDALVRLAKKYTNMKFIIRDAMWGDYGALFDTMWRCPNVYAECSRMHVEETFSLFDKYIGKGRLVFGKGYRALSGAAMAAIRYSGQPEEEQEQIAGKRLLSMLPNRAEAGRIAAAAKELEPQIPNHCWNEFMRGNGIRDMKIIDAHTHLGDTGSNGWFIELAGFDEWLDNFIARGKELGIDEMIASGYEALFGDPLEGNRYLERMTERCRDMVKCYYVYNPIYGEKLTEAELDERFAGGAFVGIKTLADYWHVPVTDPSYTPAWEYAAKHRLPILFHSWDGGFDTPDQIAQVAEKYPEATFILAHSGGGDIGRLQAEAACLRLPNVYLEFCGSFCAKRNWRDTLDTVGADRVVFGTDTEGHDPAWELGRLLSENVTDGELELIFSKNMEKILARRI